MSSEDIRSKFNEAQALCNAGDYERVIAIVEECLPKTKKENDKASEALFLKLQAQVYSDQDQLRESLQVYKQMESIYITLDDHVRQLHTLRHIGSTFHALGELECAEKCLIQVIDAYGKDSPNDLESANAVRIYALVIEESGKNDVAIKYWEQARSLYNVAGIKEGIMECEAHLKKLKPQD